MEKRSTTGQNKLIDPELDVTSPHFNPVKALESKETKIPFPKAKIFDNIGVLSSKFDKLGGVDVDINKPGPSGIKKPQSAGDNISPKKELVKGRRFLPHQLPVRREPPKRSLRNVFTRMEECVEGPLALLRKFMVNKERVTIYTRKEHGVRGTITGYVEAFDKHWNVALTDCYEVWKRRKFSCSENKLPLLGSSVDCTDLLRQMGIKLPEIKAQSLNRKYVQCSRSCPKLLVRGEQIVLITKAIDKSDNKKLNMKPPPR